jgi:hypothetical protein
MRGRVRQLPNGTWEVAWRVERRYPTKAEATDAAKRLPGPAVQGRQPTPVQLRLLMLKLADAGFGPTVIARGLNWADVPSPSGGSWSRSTVNSIVVKERKDAALRKRRKRRV